MHPLVPPVLLGPARRDPLQPDPQVDPPHRQPAQPARAAGGEGHAVVRTQPLGQPAFAEQPLEGPPHRRPRGALQPAAGEQVAAAHIADRERVAQRAVAETELPLEVHRPDAVGTVLAPAGALRPLQPLAPPTRLDQLGVAQDRRHGRQRGQLQPGVASEQPRAELLGPPGGVELPRLGDQPADRLGHGVLLGVAGPREVVEPLQPQLLVPQEPLVAGLAAYAEGQARRGHAPALPNHAIDESHPLFHRTGLHPRHAEPSSAAS